MHGLFHYSSACLGDKLCGVCQRQQFFRSSLKENYLGVTDDFIAKGTCPWGRYLAANGKILRPERSLKVKFWRASRTRKMAEWLHEFGLTDLANEALTDPLVRKVIDHDACSRNDPPLVTI